MDIKSWSRGRAIVTVVALAVVDFIASQVMSAKELATGVRVGAGVVALLGTVVLVAVCYVWVSARNKEEFPSR
jgi:hypothetical protein